MHYIKITIFLLICSFSFITTSAKAWSLLGPNNFEDCQQKSAKDAKSNAALTILLRKCNADFPGRRAEDGSYQYYDVETNSVYKVSSPKMSKKDWENIQSARIAFREAQLTRERINLEALNKIEVVSWTLRCTMDYVCMEKQVTVNLKNNSAFTINKVGIGWVIAAGKLDCNGSLGETGFKYINIGPSQKATISFKTYDGPDTGRITGCLGVTSVAVNY
jgi:hypothetical protein